MRYNEAITDEVFTIIKDASKETGIKAYVIGGFVRDYFLGITNDDIDIVVEGSGIDFAKYIGEKIGSNVQFYENYGTAMVRINKKEVEFVGARKEMYERGSRNPIVEDGTIRDDQLRRDFTINAMAFSLNEEDFGELIDPFNGMEDLKNGTIRIVQDPDITFSDDPLRMYRAIRFVSKIKPKRNNAHIEEKTLFGIVNNTYRTNILSQERVTAEIEKLMGYPDCYEGFETMAMTGLSIFADNEKVEKDILDSISLKSLINNKGHLIISDISSKEKYLCLKWLILYLESQKDAIDFLNRNSKVLSVEDFCKALRLSNLHISYINNAIKLLRKIAYDIKHETENSVRYASYIMGKRWDDVYIYLSLRETFGNTINDKMEVIDRLRKKSGDLSGVFTGWKCPVNGDELSRLLNIPPGKKLGKIKSEISNKILMGKLKNSKEAVLKYIKTKKYGKS